jgi:hypothetical protein
LRLHVDFISVFAAANTDYADVAATENPPRGK